MKLLLKDISSKKVKMKKYIGPFANKFKKFLYRGLAKLLGHESLVDLRANRKFFPMDRILNFSSMVEKRGPDIRADAYIAVTEMSLVAAQMLAKEQGGRVYCDAVETPRVDQRSVTPFWHERMILLYNSAHQGLLANCDGILTVSESMGKSLEGIGPPVKVIQNYRWAQSLPRPVNYIKSKCGLSKDDVIILSIGHVVVNFRTVLRSLTFLPDNYHLVFLTNNISRKDYYDACLKEIDELGLADRTHILAPVPYDELTAVASAADVGLVLFDPRIGNHAVGLPNRVFDYIHSGLPICALNIPDIVGIVEEYQIGEIVSESTPELWASAIQQIVCDKSRYQGNVLKASEALTWESREPLLLEFLENPQSVTFLSLRDLTNYNRAHRMAQTLLNSGAEVKFVTAPKSPNLAHRPLEELGVEYHLFSG